MLDLASDQSPTVTASTAFEAHIDTSRRLLGHGSGSQDGRVLSRRDLAGMTVVVEVVMVVVVVVAGLVVLVTGNSRWQWQ